MLTVCAPCSILPPPKYIYVYTWMYVHISKVSHALCVSWQCWKQFNALNYFGRWLRRSVTWVRSHHFMHAEADPFEQYLFWKLPKIPSPPRTDAGISMLRAGAGAPIKIIETTHRLPARWAVGQEASTISGFGSWIRTAAASPSPLAST